MRSQVAVQRLADEVLTCLCRPLTSPAGPPSTAVGSGSSGGGGPPTLPLPLPARSTDFSSAPTPAYTPYSTPLGAALYASPGGILTSHALGPSRSGESGASGAVSSGISENASALHHQHVASSILSGAVGFVPEVLSATPPELLVSLLQQCTQQRSGAEGPLRGFQGRPQPQTGVATAAGPDATTAAGMSCVGATGGLPPQTAAGRGGPGPAGAAGAGAFMVGTRGVNAYAQGGSSALALGEVDDGVLGGLGEEGSEAALLLGLRDGGLPQSSWRDEAHDRRLALLLALMGRCALDPDAFAK